MNVENTPTRNIHQRLAAVMAEVSYIQKEKKQGMQYTIVSHDAVTAKVRPVLLQHGVVYHPVDLTHEQVGNRTQVALTVRFVNVDDPADYIDVPSLGYGIDNQDKGPGKAISYAVKYSLLKALGLETGDDADHDDIAHGPDRAEEEAAAQRDAKINTKIAALQTCETEEELDAFVKALPAWLKREEAMQQAGTSHRNALKTDPAKTMAGG